MSAIRSNGGMNGVSIANVMLKTMFRGENLLNFCHLNVSSVKPKIDELRSVFVDTNAHAVSFSETWFKSYVSDKSVEMNGYKLARCDRRLKRSGGVAIYVKNNVKFRVIASSQFKYDLPVADRFMTDYLLIELIFPDVKILYGVFYKAVNTNEFNVVADVINEFAADYEHVVFAGDFNENLLDVGRRTRMTDFENVFSGNGLNVLNELPTHYYESGSSLLDLFISRRVDFVKRIDQLDTGMSRHDILVMSYYCPSVVPPKQRRCYRNIHGIDEGELLKDAMSLPWNDVFGMTDSDAIISLMIENWTTLLDKHAPLKPVREHSKCDAPWFTREISLSLLERDIAKRFWKLVRTSEAHDDYRKLRNKATALIVKAKNSYYDCQFRNCKDSKSIWSKLKNLGVGKCDDAMNPPFTADEFNRHLCGKAVNSLNRDSSVSTSGNDAISMGNLNVRTPISFSFHGIGYEDTLKSIMQVTSKAV